jgi:hypothetical protein
MMPTAILILLIVATISSPLPGIGQAKADDCLGLAAAGLRAENTGNITKINAANAATMDCMHNNPLYNSNNSKTNSLLVLHLRR